VLFGEIGCGVEGGQRGLIIDLELPALEEIEVLGAILGRVYDGRAEGPSLLAVGESVRLCQRERKLNFWGTTPDNVDGKVF
jgi:hypothetical protein